jgi:hypothetical protein
LALERLSEQMFHQKLEFDEARHELVTDKGLQVIRLGWLVRTSSVKPESPFEACRSTRIRIAILAFPIGGFIAAVAALVPGVGINPSVDPGGFAQAANLVGLANLAGILSLVFLIFGFQALYSYLERPSVGRWAFPGFVLSVIGLALYLPFLGIIAFAGPVAGRFYLNGQTQAVNLISEATSTSNLAVLAFGGVSLLSSVLGSILFSMAIWRSGKLPKWSAVAYVISAPLSWTPHYIPILWFLGGILLLGAGIGFVRGTWRTR